MTGQDLRGRSHYELFPEIPDRWKDVHRRCLGGAVERAEEDCFQRADGTTQWLRWEIRPWHEPSGAIGGIVIFSEDITDRKRAEVELRQSRDQLARLAENLPHSIVFQVTLDTSGQRRFSYFSGAIERALGIPAEDVMADANALYQWILEPFRPVLERAQAASTQNRSPLDVELPFRAKDGSVKWIHIRSAPHQREDGRPMWDGIATDVTERKRAEQARLEMESRLLHAQKLESIGILAGGIAHDFNNILSGIMGYAELALMRLPASEPAREDIEVIKKAVRRAADLTRQMLAYSGKGKFIVESVDLSRVVEDSRKILDMSVSKKAALTCDLAADLPVILADASQICQVVMNLVINASEALGEQTGAIAVSTSALQCNPEDLPGIAVRPELPEGLYVCLQVADSGCGMDPQTRAKIFDPFFTTKFTGRGLGLAAVQGIVRSHKGAIQVFSEPGKGTTFRVFFPASGPAASAVRSEPLTAPGRGSGTVLVVDDEATICTLTQQMLTHAGFSVLTAGGGREAIRLFGEHQHEVSCVLLDLTMPDLDGAETFHELRRIRPDVRVILSSGFSEEAATGRFAGQGLAGFIQKPYQFEALIARIQQALGAVAPSLEPGAA